MAAPDYSGEQVDSLLVKFEASAERLNAVKSSQVKLVAAERDILNVAEHVRDLLELAVKGDKHHLAEVFGGPGLQRFHRFRNAMDTVELSPMHADDQRWGHLKAAMDMVEEILKQLGQFKPFVRHGPPESIVYSSVPLQFAAGDVVKLTPDIEGGEPSSFTVEPPLPDGLSINLIGEIVGTLPADTPPKDRECKITASNPAGTTRTVVKFCIRSPGPKNVEYPDAGEMFTGEAVHLTPTFEGGAPTAFSVEPALPRGLELDATTGVIRGTPLRSTTDDGSATYQVTASNDSGSTTATINLQIMPASPMSLAYPGLQPEYLSGAAVNVVPEVGFKGKEPIKKDAHSLASEVFPALMEELEFTISPDLPAGLSLSPATGVLSGSPTEASPETEYKVTVRTKAGGGDYGGECSADISFAVKVKPPSDLRYPDGDCTAYTGSPFSLVPELDGFGQEWSIEPALPSGLELDSATGAISGIPTEVTSEGASWTVTARNPEGETSSDLHFVIRRCAPSELAYPTLLGSYPVRRPVEGLCPSFVGEVDEFTISPELPAGLEFNSSTGEISGTPKEVTEEKAYEVVAKNDTGEAQTSLSFAIRLIPPEELKYPAVDDSFHVGEDVQLEASIEGGVTAWQIEPALPEGLVFDESTGSISGKPAGLAEEQQYVVTASNEAGGTSAELTFKVIAPKPEGLAYPDVTDSYEIGQEVKIVPEVVSCMYATFTVKPDLPEGLTLDPKTGEISGTPEAEADHQEYTVTATNGTGSTSAELAFEVVPAQAAEVDEAFATQLEAVTDVASLPAQPRKRLDWMLWMVHRAWLDDPTLENFVFTNMKMPLPHEDPRIAPKLMKALETNTHITNLELGNSNLQRPQGPQLANALSQNQTLRVLNVDSNNLDAECIIAIANALRDNQDNALEQLRINAQKTLGENIGRSAEEALAEYVGGKSSKIEKLGCPIVDPTWRNKIDTAILHNVDKARRRRQTGTNSSSLEEIRGEKLMTKIVLSAPPTTPAAEIFSSGDDKEACLRLAMAEAKQLPTRDRFQNFAKSKGISVGYSQTGPVLKEFTKSLLTAMYFQSLTITDDRDNEYDGKLRSVEEKNDHWSLDVPTDAGRFIFVSSKTPIVRVSEAFAEWIRPSDA